MYDLVYIILGFYILYFIVLWYFKVETGARTCQKKRGALRWREILVIKNNLDVYGFIF
jgi:hypothetical protein